MKSYIAIVSILAYLNLIAGCTARRLSDVPLTSYEAQNEEVHHWRYRLSRLSQDVDGRILIKAEKVPVAVQERFAVYRTKRQMSGWGFLGIVTLGVAIGAIVGSQIAMPVGDPETHEKREESALPLGIILGTIFGAVFGFELVGQKTEGEDKELIDTQFVPLTDGTEALRGLPLTADVYAYDISDSPHVLQTSMTTDQDGIARIDPSAFLTDAPKNYEGDFRVECVASTSLSPTSKSFDFAISYDEVVRAMEAAKPCDLITEVKFQDRDARLPNNSLDAAEEASLLIGVKNMGRGAGYGVALNLSSNNSHVAIFADETIGGIPPGESRQVTIPISADLNASDGIVMITIETAEQRGYDARPVKLRIPVSHLDKPVLEIASVDLNDGSGLAEGNGNGMPENNERIELVAFVRNRGVGEAQDVTVKVVSLNSDLTPVQTEDRLSTILPGQTERARFSFSIPRLFSDPTIRYRLEAEDALGASQTGRSFEIPFQQNVPILAYETRILDAQGSSVESLTNDEEFVWEITPSNTGQNAAQEVRISVRANQPGIRFDRSRSSLGELAPGQRGASEHFRFQIPRTFAGTEAVLQLELGQSEFDSKHEEKTIPVRLRRPRLLETHELVDANRNGVIEQGEMVTFSVRVRNEGDLDARDVKVGLDVPKEWVEFEDEKLIGTLLPGESQTVSFDILIKGRTEVGDLPVHLAVHQSDGFGDIEETLSYAVTEMQARVEVVEGERQERAPTAVAPAMLNLEPLVTIAFPVDGSTVREETVRFEGAATARGERKRIVSTVVTVNGVRQGLKDRRGLSLKSREGIAIESVGEGQVQFTGYLRLREGANTIRVKALDNDNLSFEKTVTVTRQGKMPTLWAVVVGVSRYQDEQLNLRYADRDARAFYDFLRTPAGGGLDDEHIVLLTNEQATHDQILGRLTNFLRQAQEEDAVILFLACHGVIDAYGELYFLGHNSDQDNLIGTAVAQDDLMKVVGRVIKAQKKVLYIDACHSGEFGMSPTLAMRDDRARLTNKLVLKIAEADPSLAIFSASGGSEFSREDQRWGGGHGVFTYYLLKGLRGEANADGNDMVTIGELEDYLRREVGRATDNKQRPEVKGWRKAEFPLSVVK